MYIFRFNPVYEQWVVLGGTPEAPLSLRSAHFFDQSSHHQFKAATHPRQQFVIDPPSVHHSHDQHLLYKEQPPVGEHEILVYLGKNGWFAWEEEEWQQWAELVQHRLLQVHHNPHLHYLYLVFDTGKADSLSEGMRVGDILAVSHPVAGAERLLECEVASKLLTKEEMFVVRDAPFGHLYVPSAPLHQKEIWYIPDPYRYGFEQAGKEEIQALAAVLADLLPALHKEFPDAHFELRLHTGIAGKHQQVTWWLQLYEKDTTASLLPTRPIPESFLQRLHYILAKPE